jgi:threonine dehydrogenase-like Zn-dependent dehydrogenase
LEGLKNQLLIVFGAAVVVVVACGPVGQLLGKSIAARQEAMDRVS